MLYIYKCTSFVDFRKAFDTVRHEELFYKLRTIGISDLFYNVIKNMYSNIELCAKANSNSLTDNFKSSVGSDRVIILGLTCLNCL